MSKRTCRSCNERIPAKLEDYLGVVPNTCLNCLLAAVRELNKEERLRYYCLEGDIDV